MRGKRLFFYTSLRPSECITGVRVANEVPIDLSFISQFKQISVPGCTTSERATSLLPSTKKAPGSQAQSASSQSHVRNEHESMPPTIYMREAGLLVRLDDGASSATPFWPRPCPFSRRS